jgi:simple sugar transport system substrate-binding protein
MRKCALLVLVLVLGLVAAACGDDEGETTTTTAATTTAAEEPLTIGLVRQLGSGDYFEQWQAGAVAEAERLGVELQIYNAEGDNAKQALDVEQAVNAGVDAIAIDHGFAETIQPAVQIALEAGIPVVAFDVDAGDERVPQVEQSDHMLAQLALDQMVADIGGEGDVIYVYVAGFAPLDRRNEVWEEVKANNPGINEVAMIGVVNDSIAASVADQAKAALQANPDTVAVFAPFDEFAKGAVLAIEELGLQDQVKVYGADISTADIGVMTAANSPWAATAATDPANVGAVTIRAAYMLAMGEDVLADIIVPPLLITQEALLAAGVTNMEELRAAFPELATPDVP